MGGDGVMWGRRCGDGVVWGSSVGGDGVVWGWGRGMRLGNWARKRNGSHVCSSRERSADRGLRPLAQPEGGKGCRG